MAEQRQNQQNKQPQQSQSGAGNQISGLGDSNASRSSGQQQQFDQSRGQQGGAPGDNRFAEHIREHQEVVDDSGRHVGVVDHIDGDRIKLARSDSSDGQHHYVLLSQVAGIEDNKVRLRERGDNDFGMGGKS